MGLFLRRVRPIGRLAGGAASVEAAHTLGNGRHAQELVEQISSSYLAAQALPAPEYAPSPGPSAPSGTVRTGGTMQELEKLVELHDSNSLTDEEFAAAKFKLLDL